MEEFKKKVVSALALDLHYSDRVHRELEDHFQGQAVLASVLVLFGLLHRTPQPVPALLFTQRTETVASHPGQMAFPGGRVEPHETSDPKQAALRESWEEVGIPQDQVEVLGRLPSLYTVTGYFIEPWVGFLKLPVDEVPLRLAPEETAAAVWIPLDQLMKSASLLTHSSNHSEAQGYKKEWIQAGSLQYPIDVFYYQNHRIWGATGAMTKNLLDRLSQVGLR
ncbi:MAG: NUDIX hydrolase [Bdellovibrionia bacterium]